MDQDARSERIAAEIKQHFSIVVSPAWISVCLQALEATAADYGTWTHQRLLEALFAQALCTDLSTAGAACLPSTLPSMHKQLLEGRYVLQVDEVVNMAAPAKERYTNTKDRCLKLHLTDGHQHVFGIEYRTIPSIHWDCPAGCKVLVENVMLRRGMLLLQPENCTVLGGKVEALEAARLRAVAAWNKPAEGRSRHDGPRDAFSEARAAAWQVPEQQPRQQQPPAAAAVVAVAGGAPQLPVAQGQQQAVGSGAPQPGIAQPPVPLMPRPAPNHSALGQPVWQEGRQQQQHLLQPSNLPPQHPPYQPLPQPPAQPPPQPSVYPQQQQHSDQVPRAAATGAAGGPAPFWSQQQAAGGGMAGQQDAAVRSMHSTGGASSAYQAANTQPYPRATVGSAAFSAQQQQQNGPGFGQTSHLLQQQPHQLQQQQRVPNGSAYHEPVQLHEQHQQGPGRQAAPGMKLSSSITTPNHSPHLGNSPHVTPHTHVLYPPANRQPPSTAAPAAGGWTAGGPQQPLQPPSVEPSLQQQTGRVGTARMEYDMLDDDDMMEYYEVPSRGTINHVSQVPAQSNHQPSASIRTDPGRQQHQSQPAGDGQPMQRYGYGGNSITPSPLQACDVNRLGGGGGAGLIQGTGSMQGGVPDTGKQLSRPAGSSIPAAGLPQPASRQTTPPTSLLSGLFSRRAAGQVGTLPAARGYAAFSSNPPPQQQQQTLDDDAGNLGHSQLPCVIQHDTSSVVQPTPRPTQQHHQQPHPAAAANAYANAPAPRQFPTGGPRHSPMVIDLLSDDDGPGAGDGQTHTGYVQHQQSVQQQHQSVQQQHGAQRLQSVYTQPVIQQQQQQLAVAAYSDFPPSAHMVADTPRQTSPAVPSPQPPLSCIPCTLGAHEDDVWVRTPLVHISDLAASKSLLSSVLVLATFYSTAKDVALLEDGTGMLQVHICPQLLTAIFNNHTLEEVVDRVAAGGDPVAADLLQQAEQLFRNFHGLMHLDLSGCSIEGGLGQEAGDPGHLPVLKGLKELKEPQDWEDVLGRLII